MAQPPSPPVVPVARPRPACSDAERRLARDLAAALTTTGRTPATDTFWVHRGATGFALLATALAAAGSVAALDHAVAGTVAVAVALLVLVLDAGARVRPWRRLVPARATQLVTVPPRRAPGPGAVDLLIAVRTDVPRTGLGDRGRFAVKGVGPERVAAVAMLALLAVCAARVAGAGGVAVHAVQAVPTLALVLAGAALLDRALGGAPGEAAHDGADAALTAALGLLGALEAAPPRRLAPTLVLCGAGAPSMRRLLRAQRRAGVTAQDLAVLELRPSPGAVPVWWHSDGVVLPLRAHPSLLGAASRAAAGERHLGAHAVRGAGGGPARAARGMRVGAMALGVPASGEGGLEFALACVRALDEELNVAGPPVARRRGAR